MTRIKRQPKECQQCKGQGFLGGSQTSKRRCYHCQGTGLRMRPDPVPAVAESRGQRADLRGNPNQQTSKTYRPSLRSRLLWRDLLHERGRPEAGRSGVSETPTSPMVKGQSSGHPKSVVSIHRVGRVEDQTSQDGGLIRHHSLERIGWGQNLAVV